MIFNSFPWKTFDPTISRKQKASFKQKKSKTNLMTIKTYDFVAVLVFNLLSGNCMSQWIKKTELKTVHIKNTIRYIFRTSLVIYDTIIAVTYRIYNLPSSSNKTPFSPSWKCNFICHVFKNPEHFTMTREEQVSSNSWRFNTIWPILPRTLFRPHFRLFSVYRAASCRFFFSLYGSISIQR